MADTGKDIVVRIMGDNSALISALKEAGVKVNEFGVKTREAGDIGKAGMATISLSAQQAAISLGLPGPVARKLGNQIDDVVASFGRFGKGIGIATVAIAAATAAYAKYADYKKSHREELERAVGSVRGEVMALYNSAGASDSVRRATYDLTVAKRELMRVEGTMLLVAWNEQLKEQTELLQTAGGFWGRLWRAIQESTMTSGGVILNYSEFINNYNKATDEYTAKQSAEVDILRKKIALLEAELKRISQAPPGYASTQYSSVEKLKDESAILKAEYDLRTAEGLASTQWMADQEVRIYNKQSDVIMAELDHRAATAEEIQAKSYQRQLGLATLYMNQRRKMEIDRWETGETVMSELSKLMDRFYTISGNKAKAFFYLSRGLAAAEAFCHYQAAAANQSKQDWGFNMATFYRGMSIAVPAAILAETFAGTSGSDPAGEGSLSTATVASATGLPETTERNQEISIYINGQRADVPSLTDKIVRELGRNNGNYGGYTVSIATA